MSGKFVVGYDDSSPARRALDFALDKAARQGGSIVLAHVMEWSPYTFLTPEELEERHARRKQEIARAETAIMGPVKDKLAKVDVPVETIITYGHIAEKLCEIAKQTGATQMVIGRDGNSALVSRVFGSTAGTLVQIAPVPCTIVP
ncbi:universal stress protein [Thalassococcus profundi]|uniref:Universal stress protein n=1 Tax=Thalassococcus profundi TaxID=2282382 RepID=A0A369TUM4_9RHOB|nr:universal stress protein [Thalassococcus profundi]RDD67857.1 universal stress protein [Thalassococcus profundi]